MGISTFRRAVLGSFAAVAMLSGCGGGSGTPLSPSPGAIAAERTNVLPAYRVLYSFKGSKDGAFPSAALAEINGTLYGTTRNGGDRCAGSLGCGTVFSVNASSGVEAILHPFKGGPADGAFPNAALTDVNGTFYGTTTFGGSNDEGTVFSISTSGTESILHSFKGAPADGSNPRTTLLNINGTLFGTTVGGGSNPCTYGGWNGCGTVFAITTSGKETIRYSFKGGNTDGQNPYAGLANFKGKLYGTTNWAGANCENGLACGTVFSMTPSGEETLLYSFKGAGDGQNPQAALVKVKRKLYGTVTGLGAYCRCGTVFAVTPSGKETVLHSFGRGYDGEVPQAALLNVNSMLYGTTAYGGTIPSGPGGTIFEISTSGKERVLHSFGGPGDGAVPVASLINVNGTLYGTTQNGGSVYCPNSSYQGCGTVFALKP